MIGTKKNVQISEENGIDPPLRGALPYIFSYFLCGYDLWSLHTFCMNLIYS